MKPEGFDGTTQFPGDSSPWFSILLGRLTYKHEAITQNKRLLEVEGNAFPGGDSYC